MSQGKHVVIEGGDGCGKSTQARRLASRLGEEGVRARLFNEPGTDFPESLFRKIMLDPEIELSPLEQLLTVSTARAITVRKIGAHKALGGWAVSDRSGMSSIAYQGWGQGMDIDRVKLANDLSMVQEDWWTPDLTIVLDLDVDAAISRMETRDKATDRYENERAAFHERVREGYLDEAHKIGAVILDASASIEEVGAMIWGEVEPLLP